MVHSSPDTNFVQEVKQLDKQKNETTDKETRKSIEQELKMKLLERGVAASKQVSQISNIPVDVVCCEVGLVVCTGVCGEQSLTPCFVYIRDVLCICISGHCLFIEVCHDQVFMLAKAL